MIPYLLNYSVFFTTSLRCQFHRFLLHRMIPDLYYENESSDQSTIRTSDCHFKQEIGFGDSRGATMNVISPPKGSTEARFPTLVSAVETAAVLADLFPRENRQQHQIRQRALHALLAATQRAKPFPPLQVGLVFTTSLFTIYSFTTMSFLRSDTCFYGIRCFEHCGGTTKVESVVTMTKTRKTSAHY